MSLTVCLKTLPPAHKWFGLALVLLALFLLYTAIFLTGALLSPALSLEQWLLHRPPTGIDCVFHQWNRFGEVPVSLFFTFILGIGCLWLGYRRRVLPYLLLLMLLCIGSEIVGKQIFSQPVPISLELGMSNLGCQQMSEQSPLSLELRLVLGMWWEAPRAPAWSIQQTRVSATTPFTLSETASHHGYPSGHATRCMFLGLILNWLVWKYVRKRLLGHRSFGTECGAYSSTGERVEEPGKSAEAMEAETALITITYGYSRDHREEHTAVDVSPGHHP